jgi:hypothetical protein
VLISGTVQLRSELLIRVVGGIAVTIDGDFTARPEWQKLFTTSSEPPSLHLRLTAARATGALRPACAPMLECDSWASFLDRETVVICGKDASRSPDEAMRIELPRNGLEGRYLYTHDWPYPVVYPFDQLLTIHTLGVGGGALVHAAGICGRDGALIVSGPSGTGKTTMSRSCAAVGADILSDERTIARRDPAGWMTGGTPWPGEGGFAQNRSVPLRGLVVLEQANENELSRLSPGRALALLYRCHFPPVWDPAASERTLTHLEQLVREVPAYLLRNKRGPESAAMLLDLVGGTDAAPAIPRREAAR